VQYGHRMAGLLDRERWPAAGREVSGALDASRQVCCSPTATTSLQPARPSAPAGPPYRSPLGAQVGKRCGWMDICTS